ncbi:hypothetical protein BH11MYX4_BH11MYX4_35570 [soil metagenome]
MKAPPMEALPGPFAAPPREDGIVATPDVLALVRAQTKALLEKSETFQKLTPEERRALAYNLVKVGAYTAELTRDQWLQAQRLGQRPVLVEHAAAQEKKRPAQDEFDTRAADAAGRVNKETLNAIAFPTFVADLIKGTFQAVVDASIQQMEAYTKLLENVAKTVDQFMSENITDNQARDYLVQGWPEHFKIEVEEGSAKVRVKDSERDPPDFKSIFGLNDDVSLDDESVEGKLVPGARRKLAQGRQQMLSTMVLMGMNRIVITSGSIKAKMGFHLQAKDTGTAESASQFDFKNDTEMSAGGGLGSLFGGPSFKSRTSIAYVSTTKKGSTDDIQIQTDLTAELDLKFKSDYFPLERFAKTGVIAQIQEKTANPVANAPAAQNAGSAGGA